jgi:hypothetical protein
LRRDQVSHSGSKCLPEHPRLRSVKREEPLEPLKPSVVGRVAGSVALACAFLVIGYGLAAREWEPLVFGVVLAVCVYVARHLPSRSFLP